MMEEGYHKKRQRDIMGTQGAALTSSSRSCPRREGTSDQPLEFRDATAKPRRGRWSPWRRTSAVQWSEPLRHRRDAKAFRVEAQVLELEQDVPQVSRPRVRPAQQAEVGEATLEFRLREDRVVRLVDGFVGYHLSFS